MSSNLARKELKQDQFTAEVVHSVDYFAAHRKNFGLYGSIIVGAAVVVYGFFYYQGNQSSARNQALGEAMALSGVQVGPATPGGAPAYATQAAKDDAITKAFNKLKADYGGSEEAFVGQYILAGHAADTGKLDEARKQYQDVADHASAGYSSLAKLAIAQIDFAENRNSEAETLLKGLIDNPTSLVSKGQATLVYAKGIAATKPDEARKLLTSLTTPATDISPLATAALAELPQK